jgi:hypothetical protein
VLPSKNDHHKFKIPINYNDFINFSGMIWISQGLLDDGTVTSDVQVFGLKIYAFRNIFRVKVRKRNIASFITSNSSCFSSDTPRLAAGQFMTKI